MIPAIARLVPHLGRLARATRWRRAPQSGRPRVWAHRGDSAHEPENTLAAFERARAVGADGIELDVRLDREGTVLVFHDATLDRLCNRPGRLAELSAHERASLRVGGQPIPTLADVLDAIELEVNVELKSDRLGSAGRLAAATARVIAASRQPDRIVVSSFDPAALLQFHRHLPDLALAYLFSADQVLPLRRGWPGTVIGASLLHPQHTLCTEARVRTWHAHGLPINTWTVDEPDELRRLAAIGVDGVFCNDPGAALAVFTASARS